LGIVQKWFNGKHRRAIPVIQWMNSGMNAAVTIWTDSEELPNVEFAIEFPSRNPEDDECLKTWLAMVKYMKVYVRNNPSK
jgi:hypothetical protein